jgi:flagellar biosynthesis protein FlhA
MTGSVLPLRRLWRAGANGCCRLARRLQCQGMSTLTLSAIRQSILRFDTAGLGIPALVFAIMAMLVLPLPAVLLDVLFTFNILISLVVILIAIGTRKPLEFSVFPSVLLFATMMRLALNVASTRIVLTKGHEGHEAAGKVIASFGEFVIAGNYVVGFIIFIILTIINFVVVTKGAGRVSEVNARFTLDAMPGKQMAIDADLNAGLIDKETATRRRDELSQEADFFGSMDGAGKFVSGDALAGLLILGINLVGGLAIGVVQHGLPVAEAGRIYTLLTIGDGLVAQVPALFLSLATAIIVTRVTTAESMTEQATRQLGVPGPLAMGAGIIALMGLVPGMPQAVFFTLAAAGGGVALLALKARLDAQAAREAPQVAAAAEAAAPKELDWDDVHTVDLIAMELGYGLIPLVHADSGGPLMARIKGVRKKLSAELGFLVQAVRIRDALTLEPDEYHIILNGVVRGRGEVKVGRELAIDPGRVYGRIDGIPTQEPAFGMNAYWIDPAQREQARSLGYTVVDPATAIATHLNRVLRENAGELLGPDDVQQLLDKLAARAPKLVEELVPAKLPLGVVTRTLQQLLTEQVPLRDLRNIVEGLLDACARTQDPEMLAAALRPRLGRLIVQQLCDPQDVLQVMTLEPGLEQMLHDVAGPSGQQAVVLEPTLASRLFANLREAARQLEQDSLPAVLVVSPTLRGWMARLTRARIQDLTVLSYAEIPEDQAVKVVQTVTADAPRAASR